MFSSGFCSCAVVKTPACAPVFWQHMLLSACVAILHFLRVMRSAPVVMRPHTRSSFMTLFIISLKGGQGGTKQKKKTDEPPDNNLLPFLFHCLVCFQEGSHAEGQSKTKQESAWLFRLWYTFDHKYPFPCSTFLVGSDAAAPLGCLPSEFVSPDVRLQAPPVCLGSRSSIRAPSSLSNMSEEESKTLHENSSSSRFPPALMNNRSLEVAYCLVF